MAIVKVDHNLKEKIYIIRGQQVMLDSDLAEIYGYEVKALNQQVKRNIERFPEDFMFQLSKEEVDENLRSQIVTLESGKYSKYLPFAFTEQGIYQLATVLRGELAVQQSIAIMRVFRAMREYITENRLIIPQQELMRLSGRQSLLEGEIREIKDTMVSRAELSEIMKLFASSKDAEEILILDGQPFKADMAYQKIYKKAKKSIIVIDDYLGIKTLHHMVHAKNNVAKTIISDNRGPNPLRQFEYDDYLAEYPGKEVSFIKAKGKIHDRFIILDNGAKDMKVFLCGSSSKDSGYKRITTITELKNTANFKDMIKHLLDNPELKLK